MPIYPDGLTSTSTTSEHLRRPPTRMWSSANLRCWSRRRPFVYVDGMADKEVVNNSCCVS
jgi:hypothetical protein